MIEKVNLQGTKEDDLCRVIQLVHDMYQFIHTKYLDHAINTATPSNLYQQIQENLSQLAHVLQTLHRQLSNIQKEVPDNQKVYLTQHYHIGGWIDPSRPQPPFPSPALKSLGFILSHLLVILKDTNSIIRVHESDSEILVKYSMKRWRSSDVLMMDMQIAKLELIVEFVPSAMQVSGDLEYLVTRKQRLACEYLIPLSDPETLEKQTDQFFTNLYVALGFCSNSYVHESLWKRRLLMCRDAIYYGVRVHKSKELANHIGIKPDPNMLKYLWNLTEGHFVGTLLQWTFPSVDTHRFFTLCFGNNENDVPVRYLSTKTPFNPTQTLIIHIHGGGFICHTSYSHQSYTRQWVNMLDIPIISIDYRTSPQNMFPEPLQDVWNVYRWARGLESQCTEALPFTPKRIIIAGDSAGGNLAAALTIKCIQNGISPPDGLLLLYAALSLQRRYSPSLLQTLDDRLMPVGFIESCRRAYCFGENVEEDELKCDPDDPLLSPYLASDELLSVFPNTRIMVGELDPLLDQSVNYAHRLHSLNVNVKLSVYQGLMHGFLNFDSPIVGIDATHQTVVDSGEYLKELVSLFESH